MSNELFPLAQIEDFSIHRNAFLFHACDYQRPVFLLPLFSGVCAFTLAIFLAGSSPDQKLNMLGARSFMLAGSFMIVMTAFKLDLPLFLGLIFSNLNEPMPLTKPEIRSIETLCAQVAGVIGEKKFAYDVLGDTVNTASRMESSCTPGKINISGSTYEMIKDVFDFEFRGNVSAKNKGEVAIVHKDSNSLKDSGKYDILK